jgi:D-glycero-alpha-D-manno-heptose-7-phosphate kinase
VVSHNCTSTLYSGRKSKNILDNQKKLSLQNNNEMISNLKKVKKMGIKIKKYLEDGDLCSFGNAMNEHWIEKKRRSPIMTNEKINQWYDGALKNGALGGKILGAGGGGFFLFYVPIEKRNFFLKKMNFLTNVPFKFEDSGSQIVFNSSKNI